MSFNYSFGERVVEGRHFNDQTDATIPLVLGGSLALAEVWVTGDVRAGRNGGRWLNVIATQRDHAASPK